MNLPTPIWGWLVPGTTITHPFSRALAGDIRPIVKSFPVSKLLEYSHDDLTVTISNLGERGFAYTVLFVTQNDLTKLAAIKGLADAFRR